MSYLSRTVLNTVSITCLLFITEATAEGEADKAIVVVKLTATQTSGNAVGTPVSAATTGWFVNSDGRIITTHHIIDKLPIHDPQSREFEILFSPGDTHPQKAIVIAEDPDYDLILLKTGRPDNHGWLRFRGSSQMPVKGSDLCYVGFPFNRDSSQSRCGELIATEGVAIPNLSYLWDTSLDSADGLSGSPVYLKDCPRFAVGLIKGKDPAFGSSGYVIPAKYIRLLDELSPTTGDCVESTALAPPPPPPPVFAEVKAKATPRKPTKKDSRLRLVQMEIYGSESAYIKEIEQNGLPSYQLDPHYFQQNTRLPGGANPVFNVIIENKSDELVVLTSALYRVESVTQYAGGLSGPLIPNAKYHHALLWQKGDQIAPLVPGYQIAPHSIGSFLLEITSIKRNAGLAWTMHVDFQTSEGTAVSSSKFELVMSKGVP